MDFKTIKEKLVGAGKKAKDEVVSVSKKAKDGVVSGTNKAINFSATKLSKSGATIRDRESLLSAIEKSKNTEFKNEKTGEKGTNIKRTIIIFGSEKSDFFKEALVNYPVLLAKAFSQNIELKLAISTIKNVDLKTYGIKKMPSLVVFENTKVKKIISDKEKILKLVKSINLDINKEIDNL